MNHWIWNIQKDTAKKYHQESFIIKMLFLSYFEIIIYTLVVFRIYFVQHPIPRTKNREEKKKQLNLVNVVFMSNNCVFIFHILCTCQISKTFSWRAHIQLILFHSGGDGDGGVNRTSDNLSY